jgi:hypothetical protein
LLTINRIAELFGTTKQTISQHLLNIFETGELKREATVKEILTVQKEGNRNASRNLDYFNLSHEQGNKKREASIQSLLGFPKSQKEKLKR